MPPATYQAQIIDRLSIIDLILELFMSEVNVESVELDKCYHVISFLVHTRRATVEDLREI